MTSKLNKYRQAFAQAMLEDKNLDLLKGGTGSLPPTTNGIVVIDDVDGL